MIKKQLTTDPLNEKQHEVLPQLIHKYPNRVLCLLTTECQAHCPFCFRRDLHAQQTEKNPINLKEIIDYVKKSSKINEFIFSGGEPLLEGDLLETAFLCLQKIEHLKIFRIHSRLPIVQKQKIPWQNLEIIAKRVTKPIYFVIHVNSDQELNNPNVSTTLIRLRKLGFILLSHTVFLKGINDNLTTLEKLFNQLIELGVKPYYIFHCDQMLHTQQFVLPLEKERQLMTKLRKKVSGLAFPLHVIDSENGKIPVPSTSWSCATDHFYNFANEKIKSFG